MEETKKKQSEGILPSQLWGRGWGRGSWSLYFRQALHMMKEERLFSSIYIAGTALAIAFTMVIAVVFYAKLADIEPEVHRSRTVYVDSYRTRKDYGSMSYGFFSREQMIDWFYHMKSVEVACCVLRSEKFNNFQFHLKTDGGKRIIQVVLRGVDANFFKVYRHHFVYGRPFTMEEGLPTDSSSLENVFITIISKDISEQVFGKDVDPVGKTIRMNNNDYRIVGVIEPTSSIASQSYGQVFVPATDGADGVTIVMKEGCTLEDVKKELDEKVHRYNMSDEEYTMEVQLYPHARAILSRGHKISSWKDILLSLLPKMFVLLLVPALNLSGLVAARMKRRMPEMGVRKAFGAKKRELLHQVITENLVLTLCGGLVGLVITWLLLYVFRSWAFFAFGMVPKLTPEPLVQGEMLFSPFIFLIALGVCMVVNLMATFIPAWWSLRNPIVESMNQKK